MKKIRFALTIGGVAFAIGCGGGVDPGSEFDASSITTSPGNGMRDSGSSIDAPGPTLVTHDAGNALMEASIPDALSIDCDATPSLCIPAVCGDGLPGPGESCDDHNTVDGDGCSSTCQIEASYWACMFGQPCVDVRSCAELLEAGVGDASGCTTSANVPICGNKIIDPGEACDDGNVMSGDGCSYDCKTVEANYVCPTPGQPCVSTVVCGDGMITGTEQCDDGNTTSGDGCTGDTCQLEPGWTCLVPATSCTATKCGDGYVAGAEQCDDGNMMSGDGCSSSCQLETSTITTNPTSTQAPSTIVQHYQCSYPTPPLSPLREVCTITTCGNHVVEGDEQCDDGNNVAFDGCSPTCQLEPNCPNGACVPTCGDGLLFDYPDATGKPTEQCDDGNTTSGDGCSSTCMIESGYACTTVTNDFPAYQDVPVVLRDFKYWDSTGTDPTAHPDFERYCCGVVTGLVQNLLMGGVPIYAQAGGMLTSALDFTDWYQDIDIPVNGVNVRRSKRIDDVQMRLTRTGTTGAYSYVFDSDVYDPYKTIGGWFPLDGRGWGNQGGNAHNFSFTTELRYWFTYDASTSPTLTFSGDDDVWVFVDDHLALDIGGVHGRSDASFVLDPTMAGNLGLVDKHVYEAALFNAERHTTQSNFSLTLTGFVRKESVCSHVCGDGIKTREEQCDQGAANVNAATTNPLPYGSCTTTCLLGPHCGDGTPTTPPEDCDNGTNLTPWVEHPSATTCGPGCKAPAYCGDDIVQSAYGEQCDKGVANTDDPNSYDTCTTSCVPGPRCGDGHVDANYEQCDNGYNVTAYVTHLTSSSCAPGCRFPHYCGDSVVDVPNEQCDLGAANTDDGAYGLCTTSCLLGPRCGDGIVQSPEECDDGNRVNGDGCSAACQKEGGNGPR